MSIIPGGRIVNVSSNADVVPLTNDKIQQWCRLSYGDPATRDPTSSAELVYIKTNHRVTIEVQGIFLDGALTSLGDALRPTRPSTHDAVQYLRLIGSFAGIDRPFQHQMHVLARLTDIVFRQLGIRSTVPTNYPDTLTLRRRIRGVTPSQNNTLDLFMETDPGCRTKCTALDIGFGDLIEALVKVDIVLERGEDGLPRTHVFLSPERVTRIHPRRAIRAAVLAGPIKTIAWQPRDYFDRGNIGYTSVECTDGSVREGGEDLAELMIYGSTSATEVDKAVFPAEKKRHEGVRRRKQV